MITQRCRCAESLGVLYSCTCCAAIILSRLLLISAAGILGGAAWEGSRVTFDEAAAGGAASPMEGAAPLSGLAEQLKGVKWKKITMATLKQASSTSNTRL